MLNKHEKKVFSQNGEDGIIEHLLDKIQDSYKYYVEFGVQKGTECNTRLLREKKGFTGIMMDCENHNPEIGLYKEFITKDNINDLFKKHNVPNKFDVLSIDIDYNDLWVWKNINNEYQPSIVVIEYNAVFIPPISVTVPYNERGTWDGTSFFGASLEALNKVAEEKGYSLVGCDNRGINSFFVLNRYIGEEIKKINTLEAYKSAGYGFHKQKILGNVTHGHRPFDESKKKFVRYPENDPINLFI